MSDSKQQCSCLYGTAVIDPVTDQCYCLPVDQNTGVGVGVPRPPLVKPLLTHGPDGGVWAYMPYSGTSVINTDTKTPATTTPAGDGTILGMKPIVALGIAVAAFWLFSQDGKSQKAGG